MAIDKTYQRPVATQFSSETSSITMTYTEGTGQGIVDAAFVDGGGTIVTPKEITRFKVTPVFSGTRMRFKIEVLQFDGSTDAISATDPADSTAVGTTKTFFTEYQDMDAAHTAAGDARS